jgi:hypothetical protein
MTGVPGAQVPDLPPAQGAAASSPEGQSPTREALPKYKDLAKKPKTELAVGESAPKPTAAPEARTEAEALELANAKGRAVFGPKGWVCPSRQKVA